MSITYRGVQWLTADEARAQLGPDITPELLRDWKRRGLIRGTILRGTAVYRLDDLLEAEAWTRREPRGRPRAGGSHVA